mmetsp:Transcript_14153/g.26511  ORF Transcript_14153/g.26511 Transcript_14153/m.26511 type:complete len:211 (+) Transcript_14153:202-834(+)
MLHCFFGQNPLRMIVHQHPVYEIQHVQTHQMLILGSYELRPRFSRMPAQNVVKVRVQFLIVLVQIGEQAICAKHASDFHKLVVIVLAVEERLLAEYHARQHAPQTPNVQGVIIQLQVDQKLGTLVVSGGDSDIVLSVRVIKLGEAPINEPKFPVLVVNHDIVRLDVPVHDPLRMAVVESPENLEDVVADVVIGECGIQLLEISVVDVLEY